MAIFGIQFRLLLDIYKNSLLTVEIPGIMKLLYVSNSCKDRFGNRSGLVALDLVQSSANSFKMKNNYEYENIDTSVKFELRISLQCYKVPLNTDMTESNF